MNSLNKKYNQSLASDGLLDTVCLIYFDQV